MTLYDGFPPLAGAPDSVGEEERAHYVAGGEETTMATTPNSNTETTMGEEKLSKERKF